MTNAFIIYGGELWPPADIATVNNSRLPLRIAPCHADVVSIAFRLRQGNFSTRWNGSVSWNHATIELVDRSSGHRSFFLIERCQLVYE